MSKTDLSIVQLIFSLFIFLFSGFVITFLWRRNQRNHNRLVKFQLFGLGFAGITLERVMKRSLDLPVNLLVGSEIFYSSDMAGAGNSSGWASVGVRLDYGF